MCREVTNSYCYDIKDFCFLEVYGSFTAFSPFPPPPLSLSISRADLDRKQEDCSHLKKIHNILNTLVYIDTEIFRGRLYQVS